MPVDLSSLMGSNFQGSGATGTDASGDPSTKKKLKKVGNHWEDEQGNQFADAEGTQPIKSETAQAKAGAPSQSVMDSFPLERATKTAGWAAGDGTPAQEKQPDWQVTPNDKTRSQGNETSQPSGTSDEEYFNKYFELAYPNGVSDKDMKKLRQMWSGLSQTQKDQWMEQAQQRKKKAKSSVMG